MTSSLAQKPAPKLDHSIFDADIHGQSMNMVYLGRIFSWIGPHRKLAAFSILLVMLASLLAVLLPVVISRVVIDGIIVGQSDLLLPDFGMNALNNWLAGLTGWQSIISACFIYALFTVLCHTLYHFHRITFARTVLHSLRDMRLDLFAHMEHRPSSFYDKVAVGRVMDALVRPPDGLADQLLRCLVVHRLVQPVSRLAQGFDGYSRSDLTRGRSAHPVGNRDDESLAVGLDDTLDHCGRGNVAGAGHDIEYDVRVLVVLANKAYIGESGKRGSHVGVARGRANDPSRGDSSGQERGPLL